MYPDYFVSDLPGRSRSDHCTHKLTELPRIYGDQAGLSDRLAVSRCGRSPSASVTYTASNPSRAEMNVSRVPSGDQLY
jgi:hypothetical protein